MGKKVLIVATLVKKHINVFHLPYIKLFKENGYETHVAAKNDFGNYDELTIPNCDIYYDINFDRFPISIKNIIAYKKLKEIINKNNYDIIQCNTPIAAFLTRIAGIKSRKKGTRIIYTAHGFHFFKGSSLLNWILYYPLEKVVSYFTDTIITINKEDYNRAVKKMKAKEIYYVPGIGVDTKKLINTTVDKFKKKSELGLPKDSIVLLSVGELNKNKNHKIIINALARLNNTNVHYCIAGEGKLYEKNKSLVNKLNLNEQVHFLGFRKDVNELCAISDIFCFPSFREGLSLSLMEAMASGLPIICSDIRGNSDLIVHDKGGYLCNPSSVDAFEDAIRTLIDNNIKRKSFGKYNKDIISMFDITNVIDIIKRIYLGDVNEKKINNSR